MSDEPTMPAAGDAGPIPEPSGQGNPGGVADEMLVHGLLSLIHVDDAGAQEGRIRAALEGVRDAGGAVRPARRVRRARLLSVATAVCALALTLGLWYFWGRTESSASAIVRAAARATGGPGDRRYEVRALRPPGEQLEETPFCILDMRFPNLLLIRADMPGGVRVVVGRDDKGIWAIRRDGGIERERARAAWPGWSGLGDQLLFADSLETLLDDLAAGYELERLSREALAADPRARLEHVVGRRKEGFGPGASAVQVWIDPRTSVAARIELSWDDAALAMAASRPGRHPPPPRLLVFERVEAPDFPKDWFAPATHASLAR